MKFFFCVKWQQQPSSILTFISIKIDLYIKPISDAKRLNADDNWNQSIWTICAWLLRDNLLAFDHLLKETEKCALIFAFSNYIKCAFQVRADKFARGFHWITRKTRFNWCCHNVHFAYQLSTYLNSKLQQKKNKCTSLVIFSGIINQILTSYWQYVQLIESYRTRKTDNVLKWI